MAVLPSRPSDEAVVDSSAGRMASGPDPGRCVATVPNLRMRPQHGERCGRYRARSPDPPPPPVFRHTHTHYSSLTRAVNNLFTIVVHR